MKLPTDVARNQTPIISPPIRAGASFVIALRPTGLRQSSPNVCSRYTTISHIGLTCAPPCGEARRRRSGRRSRRPTRTSPSENFTGVDGSSRSPSRSHSHANTGAKRPDEQRVHRLEPAARIRPAEDRRPRVAIGEEVERRSGLFEERPEERRGEEEDADRRTAACARRASSRRARNSQPKNATQTISSR